MDVNGSTNEPSDTDINNAVGSKPNYVLGYEARIQTEQSTGQIIGEQKTAVKHYRYVSVYDKNGNVSKPFDFHVFRKSSIKINNQ